MEKEDINDSSGGSSEEDVILCFVFMPESHTIQAPAFIRNNYIFIHMPSSRRYNYVLNNPWMKKGPMLFCLHCIWMLKVNLNAPRCLGCLLIQKLLHQDDLDVYWCLNWTFMLDVTISLWCISMLKLYLDSPKLPKCIWMLKMNLDAQNCHRCLLMHHDDLIFQAIFIIYFYWRMRFLDSTR